MKTLTLSILQFNTFVKNILDAEVFLSNIGVFGEVTNYKVSGGNAYFDLKDENAMLSCIKFDASGLNINNGDKLIVFGRVNFYIKSGKLNFIVSRTQAYGMGDLYQKFLELKNKLEMEGFFREEIKKTIPKFSKRIGVVTSETGAVIRDIINVTRKKNPYTDIVVFPSKVQGVGAEDDIKKGVEYFNGRTDIDVIIIARGGGSLEDLAPFNTETVVKAIYNSKLPVISAVGHETDFTLCDFASDLRVPTPSVGAEVAVFDYYKECDNIKSLNIQIYQLFVNKLQTCKNNLAMQNEFITKNIKILATENKAKLLEILKENENLINLKMTNQKNQLEKTIEVLTKLSPLEILKRGFSVVEKNAKRVSSVKHVEIGDELKISFDDGKILARVTKKEN